MTAEQEELFYNFMAHALGGLCARGEHSIDPEQIAELAYDIALAAMRKLEDVDLSLIIKHPDRY